MKYIDDIPVGEKVLVTHYSQKQKIEGMISHNYGDKFYFHSEVLHGGNPNSFGYSKSWSFSRKGPGNFTEGIQFIELLNENYEIY